MSRKNLKKPNIWFVFFSVKSDFTKFLHFLKEHCVLAKLLLLVLTRELPGHRSSRVKTGESSANLGLQEVKIGSFIHSAILNTMW